MRSDTGAECCEGLGRWSISRMLPDGERTSDEFEDSGRVMEKEFIGLTVLWNEGDL